MNERKMLEGQIDDEILKRRLSVVVPPTRLSRARTGDDSR